MRQSSGVPLVREPSMAHAEPVVRARPPARGGFGAHERRGAWWTVTLVAGLVLLTFVVYATCRAFHNDFYELGRGAGSGYLADHAYLLSPFCSPLLAGLIPRSRAWLS